MHLKNVRRKALHSLRTIPGHIRSILLKMRSAMEIALAMTDFGCGCWSAIPIRELPRRQDARRNQENAFATFVHGGAF